MFFIYFNDILTLPQTVTDEFKQQGIADVIKRPAQFIDEKLVPIFQKQPTKLWLLKLLTPHLRQE